MNPALKDAVVAANQSLVAHGLVTLTWGNVSAYDPESKLVAIKPSGVAYQDLQSDSLPVLNLAGEQVAGDLEPSSDAKTHLELYRHFPGVTAVVHTHSLSATAFSQAGRSLPCFGTTHADHFYGEVPLIRPLTAAEAKEDYEHFTGVSIVEHFTRHQLDPKTLPACLLHHHAPFAWGSSLQNAVDNAVALEMCCRMALDSLTLNPSLPAIPQHLLDQHHLRKHGPEAYYGQGS